MTASVSPASDVALARLNAIRPNDGWAVKRDRGGVRLYRRNIPLTDNVFLDVHYDDASRSVVGMVSKPAGANPMATAQVLVGPGGSPSSTKELIQVRSYKPDGRMSRSAPDARRISSPAVGVDGTLTDEQNKQLIKFVGVAIGSVALLKILVSKLSLLFLLILPVVYVYATISCPSRDSFDAKKELKRVLRGHHLPNNHPDKPRGMFEKFAARVAATITTELATLPGYSITTYELAGAALLINVEVPTAEMEFYWIGVFDKWHHVYARKMSN